MMSSTRTIALAQNYCSTRAIGYLASARVGAAARQYLKRLVSERGAGTRARHVTVASSHDAAVYLADVVLEWCKTGVDLKYQAVLFRHAHHANDLEPIRRDSRFCKYVGLEFLEAAHVRDLRALLRVDRQSEQRDRRLMYVAFTRAKNPLELISPLLTTSPNSTASRAVIFAHETCSRARWIRLPYTVRPFCYRSYLGAAAATFLSRRVGGLCAAHADLGL